MEKPLKIKKVTAKKSRVLESSSTLSSKVKKKPRKTTSKKLVKENKKTKKLVSKKLVTENVKDEVSFPSSASLRLLEKVELYKIWYNEILPKQASTAAKVVGYCFILVGAAFVSFGYLSNKDFSQNTAALICSTSLCDEVVDVDLPPSSPEVLFLNSLPKNLHSDNDILIKSNNVTSIKVFVISTMSGQKLELNPLEKQDDDTNRYLIPVNELNGAYTLTAEVVGTNEVKYVFKGQDFTVIDESSSKPLKPVPQAELSSEVTSTSSTSTVSVLDDTVIATSTDIKEIEPESTDSFDTKVVSIAVEESNGAEFVKVAVGDFDPDSVQIYGEIPGTQESLLIGDATLVQGIWYLSLSALNLPNYTLNLYASFLSGETRIKSIAIPYQKLTLHDEAALIKTEDLAILAKKVDLALQDSNFTELNRASYFDLFSLKKDDFTENQLIRGEILDFVSTKIEERSEELNYLMLIYASALQTNHPFLTKLAIENITNLYHEVISLTLEAENQGHLKPALSTIFTKRLDLVLAAIQDNETKLSNSSNQLISRDSDRDGLSDYDEFIHFNTDPNYPDMDNDGVIDSIEIATINNPFIADVKNNPKLNSLSNRANDPIITITGAEQQIIKDQKKGEQLIYNISGRTIPNTFAYVVSKSSKSISIVKANDVGNFSLALENQPENLPVNVQAGLVDNNGEFKAISKEFIVNRNESNQIASVLQGIKADIDLERSNKISNSIIIGSLLLVALGFILLLLSHVILTQRRSFLAVKAVK